MKTGKEAANEMAVFVNNMVFDPTEFVEEFSKEHRTLQQSFTWLCLTWLQKLAEMEKAGYYDPRNEFSVKLAKQIMEKVEEANWTRIPFI